MASQLARQQTRIVAYLPGLRSLVRHFRAFSSSDEFTPSGMAEHPTVLVGDHSGAVLPRHWPDSRLGPLNSSDLFCPLPGNIGVGRALNMQQRAEEVAIQRDLALAAEEDYSDRPRDFFSGVTPHQHQMDVMESFQKGLEELQEPKPEPMDHLECVITICPMILKKDLPGLFPGREFSRGDVTVICVNQKTDNDMTAWCEEVETEREMLLDHFINGAQDICSNLQEFGYWADFIDPSSGRPYHGAFTNATLFETDERYRQLGYEIDDLGCCKVIRHHLWGTHAYVGSIFTDAPMSHPVLQALVAGVYQHFEL